MLTPANNVTEISEVLTLIVYVRMDITMYRTKLIAKNVKYNVKLAQIRRTIVTNVLKQECQIPSQHVHVPPVIST
jgi:hypothetical protein